MTRFTDRIRRALAAVKRWHRHAMVVAVLAVAQLLDATGVGKVPEHKLDFDAFEVTYQHAVVNFWVQIAIMIVAALVAYALAPKPPIPKPASLEDFDVPTAEEGRPIPVVFGTVWIKGPNCLWYGDLSSIPIRSGGGKK